MAVLKSLVLPLILLLGSSQGHAQINISDCIEALIQSTNKQSTEKMSAELKLQIDPKSEVAIVKALLHLTNSQKERGINPEDFFEIIDQLATLSNIQFYPWAEFDPTLGYGTVGISVKKGELLKLLKRFPTIEFASVLKNPEGLFDTKDKIFVSNLRRPRFSSLGTDFARLERKETDQEAWTETQAAEEEPHPFKYFLNRLARFDFSKIKKWANMDLDPYLNNLFSKVFFSTDTKIAFWLGVLLLSNPKINNEQHTYSKPPREQLQLINQFFDNDVAKRAADYMWEKNRESIYAFYQKLGLTPDETSIKNQLQIYVYRAIENGRMETRLKYLD